MNCECFQIRDQKGKNIIVSVKVCCKYINLSDNNYSKTKNKNRLHEKKQLFHYSKCTQFADM
jgi:hypothetical protein